MSALILLVDDEPDLLLALEFSVRQAGFRTRSAATGKAALQEARAEPRPDLVVLDLMLPDISGTEVCRRLKADPATESIPVLMLTAKGEEIDRVVGFEVGADDYVTKPFSTRELVLRLQALVRRSAAAQPGASRFGVLRVDMDGHRVWVEDQEVALTALEFRLLGHFLARKGRVQSRDQLLEAVWGDELGDIGERTVDGQVKRLRKKLGEAGSYIETLRGTGYRFRRDPPR